jgi:hypothetical protein
MKKLTFIFILGLAVLPECFSQNMLIAGAEYNMYKPVFWDAMIGFNYMFTEHIQDDFLLSLGKARIEPNVSPKKFVFSVKDTVFYTINSKYIGLRLGVFVSAGIYEVSEYPDLFLSTGGLAGLWFFPKSLISLTVDVCPGYVWALGFNIMDIPTSILHDGGFILPIALNFHINFDRML